MHKGLFCILLFIFGQCFHAQNTCERMGLSNGWMLNLSPTEVETLCEASAATGVRYFRTDIPWTHVQYNSAEEWDWDKVDFIVATAIDEGMEVIGILDYFPPWADPSTESSFWYDFVYEAGLRYIPQGVEVWEMWNEPNISNFWPAPNSTEYVQQILIPGSNAIRQAASDLGTSVTVLTAGLAPAATDGTNISQEDFLTGIYEEGATAYFDAVGQHPYCWPLDPAIVDPFNWFLKTENLYAIMQVNGDGDKKIWGTELGWPTHFENEEQVVTELEQAEYLASAYEIWENWEWTGPLLWYAYQDAGLEIEDPEHNFGMVDFTDQVKPALSEFVSIANECLSPTSNLPSAFPNTIRIGPNPFAERLSISGFDGPFLIKLWNVRGELVHSESEASSEINVDLSSGIYLLELQNIRGRVFFKQKLVRR